ncbi:hypothetical protein SNE35_31640 [Paucibacter sp. R3-3]|uniref:ParB-like N-terminal domain-containing protein n=1 Tax=Roseateles agri TaxID=3098619 RepID=A0ABU5DRZ7_9BURK|nr:hypothetical protein [Paucibacter sp. R3-3]MDY0749092.1 hypothetical protein [Paucibacter sp. R3-3]
MVALRAQEGEGVPQYIRLGALRLDERNVRHDPPSEEEIEELADLIDAQGLLQNLSVVAYDKLIYEAQPKTRGKGKSRSRDKGQVYTHGVIAGGRRLRALLRLVVRGRISLDEEILCSVFPAERATAVSAAENSGRRAMSAADTIQAFADMVRDGAGVEELAVCFHLSPLTVQRRLKLAGVSPVLFDLFRQEGITLDQLMALALTDDHAVQEAAWKGTPAHNRSPRALRALIGGAGISVAVVKFVGMKAYQAAGGVVLQDLFAEVGNQPEYVQDPTLMMRLAGEKLEALAAKARSKGAPWVETFTVFGYLERERFAEAPTALRVPTVDEAEALRQLDVELSSAQEQLDACYDSDVEEAEDDGEDRESDGGGEIQVLEARCSALTAQRNELLDSRREVPAEIRSLVGVVIYVDERGKPVQVRKLRKDDLAAARRAASKAQAAHGDDGGEGGEAAQDGTGESKASGLSERLCRQLTSHRTRALQAVLLGRPHEATAALLHPLLAALVYGHGSYYESRSPLHLRADDCEGPLHTWAPDLEGSRAEGVVTQALEQARKLLPAEAADLLPCLLAMDGDTLQGLLTLCAVLSLDAISSNGKPHCSDVLAQAVELDMRQWWTPTGAGFLSKVSKQQIADAVAQAGMAGEAQALAKLKKVEAVGKAESLLQDKGWLPAILQR